MNKFILILYEFQNQLPLNIHQPLRTIDNLPINLVGKYKKIGQQKQKKVEFWQTIIRK